MANEFTQKEIEELVDEKFKTFKKKRSKPQPRSKTCLTISSGSKASFVA